MSCWKRLWTAPRPRDPGGEPLGLGRISTRDAYRQEQSRVRYLNRPDCIEKSTVLLTGQIGVMYGMTIITDRAI